MSRLDPHAQRVLAALARELKGYSAPARRAALSGDASRLQKSSGPWYHGTANRDFSAFDPYLPELAPRGGGSAAGVFFTNSKRQGDNFRRLALKYSDEPRDKNDGRVIEALIRGRYKPVDVPALEAARARAARQRPKDARPAILGRQREWMLAEARNARREGYDGVDFVNILDDPLSAKERATHRVVFPDRVSALVDILHSHTLDPSGVLETPISAARSGRSAPAPRAPVRARPTPMRRLRY